MGEKVALRTEDGFRRDAWNVHRYVPEAFVGGPLALVVMAIVSHRCGLRAHGCSDRRSRIVAAARDVEAETPRIGQALAKYARLVGRRPAAPSRMRAAEWPWFDGIRLGRILSLC